MPTTLITIPESPSNSDIHDVLEQTSRALSKLGGTLLVQGAAINTDWLGGMLQAAALLDQCMKQHDAAINGPRGASAIAVPTMMPPRGRGMN